MLLKRIILVLVLVLLCGSFVQRLIRFFPESSLSGVHKPAPVISPMEEWFTGQFQESVTLSLDQAAGFRNTLIRIHNQIGWSLFNISSNSNVVIGKQGWLYEPMYIEAFTGRDYIGEEAVAARVEKLNRIQAYFNSKGIKMVLAFAPSKARIFPEYLPDGIEDPSQGRSNYQEFIRQLADFPEICVIDFNALFAAIKDSVPYPLFPKYGIRWTNFISQTLITDTLVSLFVSIPDATNKVRVDSICFTDSLRTPDYDLYNLLNLWDFIPSDVLPYPIFHSTHFVKPYPYRVLSIGDSFYWNLFEQEPWNRMFTGNDFWYYGEMRYPIQKYEGITNDSIQFIREDILTHDIIFVLVTEINLKGFLHFPERQFKYLGIENASDLEATKQKEEKVQHYITLIQNDLKWFELVKAKAAKLNVSVEEMLRRDALYMIEQEQAVKTE